jgi:two-component system sensor histidine kinase ChvG
LRVKLALLLVVFIAVPAVLYRQFEESDAEQQALLLSAVRERGLVIARALEPVLAGADRVAYARLGAELGRFSSTGVTLKLLFQPARQDAGFFYVAAAPAVGVEALQRERDQLAADGVLERLAATCQGDVPLAIRLALPAGGAELVTSITPVKTPGGCWALVVSNQQGELGREIGRAYWRSPEVRLALGIYLALAAITFGIFLGLLGNLASFARLARGIARGEAEAGGFVARNGIPELDPVAGAFDRMVDTLRSAASNIRRAAEDNAHAFKTPLAIIAQAIEPLRTKGPDTAKVAANVDAAILRLNELVRVARRLDDATADFLDPPRDPVDLSALCEDLIERYEQSAQAGRAHVGGRIAPGILVVGGLHLLTVVVENLIDNALSFAPDGSVVTLSLERRQHFVYLNVSDRGPGVAAEHLTRIFDRYFSLRPVQTDPGEATENIGNFGVGLWIVRRNVEAMGGAVVAENRVGGGLQVRIKLPVWE